MKKNFRRNVEDILDELGTPLSLDGYRFLTEATLIRRDNPIIPQTDIYKMLAKRYKTTWSIVERAIRHTRDFMGDDNIKKKYKLNTRVTNTVLTNLLCREAERRGMND